MNDNQPLGNPYKEVLLALNASGCPYLVIGGVAVVQHGSSRFTPDVNLALDFYSDKIDAGIAALYELGLAGSAELPILEVKDEKKRLEFNDANGALLELGGLDLPNFSADLLLAPLENFKELYSNRMRLNAFETEIPLLSVSDLIRMKKELNRPQDQMDVEQLEFLQKVKEFDSPDAAFEALAEELPLGVDRGYFESLMEFQKLTPDERFDWLLKMLSAVGGFCVF